MRLGIIEISCLWLTSKKKQEAVILTTPTLFFPYWSVVLPRIASTVEEEHIISRVSVHGLKEDCCKLGVTKILSYDMK